MGRLSDWAGKRIVPNIEVTSEKAYPSLAATADVPREQHANEAPARDAADLAALAATRVRY